MLGLFEIAGDNRARVRVAFALDCCDRDAMTWAVTTGGNSRHLVRDPMVDAVEKYDLAARCATSVSTMQMPRATTGYEGHSIL